MAMRLSFPRPLEQATRQLFHGRHIGAHGAVTTRTLVDYPLGYVGRHRAPEPAPAPVPFAGNDDNTAELPRFIATAMAQL